MKCPQCGRNHKKREGMQCNCGYQFLFSPQSDRMTDGRFLALLRQTSRNETYYFTENQLYATYCRRTAGPPWWAAALGVIGCGAFAAVSAFWFEIAAPAIFGIIGMVISLIVLLYAIFKTPPDPATLNEFVRRWTKSRGPIEKLISQPQLDLPPPEYPESDLFDYGVERVLIVQRDLLVDLLVRNGFHAEQRALILSATGYPRSLLPHAETLLSESPDLPVFLLHDADTREMPLAEPVRRLIQGHPVCDLGLFPEDVKRIRGLRPTGPERLGYQVPVDYLPPHAMVGMLAPALLAGQPLADMLASQAAESGDTGAWVGYG